MNIREALLKEHSKRMAQAVTNYIGHDMQLFDKLLDCIESGEYRLVQRAAWPLNLISSQAPELIEYRFQRILSFLDINAHVSVKRNVIRLLQNVTIPDEYTGQVADYCFTYLNDPSEAHAVRAFSMSVLTEICKKEPELASELILMIKDKLEFSSPSFKARAAKELHKLSKIQSSLNR